MINTYTTYIHTVHTHKLDRCVCTAMVQHTYIYIYIDNIYIYVYTYIYIYLQNRILHGQVEMSNGSVHGNLQHITESRGADRIGSLSRNQMSLPNTLGVQNPNGFGREFVAFFLMCGDMVEAQVLHHQGRAWFFDHQQDPGSRLQ